MIDLRLLFPKQSVGTTCHEGRYFVTSNQLLKFTWSAPKVFGKLLMPSKKPTISIHGLLVFPWSSRWVYKASVRDIFLIFNTLLRQGALPKEPKNLCMSARDSFLATEIPKLRENLRMTCPCCSSRQNATAIMDMVREAERAESDAMEKNRRE